MLLFKIDSFPFFPFLKNKSIIKIFFYAPEACVKTITCSNNFINCVEEIPEKLALYETYHKFDRVNAKSG